MQQAEQRPVGQAGNGGKTAETEEMDAAGGEELGRGYPPAARQPIEDAADQEAPDGDVQRDQRKEGGRRPVAVGQRAKVGQRCGEADDGRREGALDPLRLRLELLPPRPVHALGGPVGRDAGAEVGFDCAVQGQRERRGQQQRRQVDAGQQGRRPGNAADAVAQSLADHQMKNPYVSSRSCSQTSHVTLHFVAAARARGASVRLLFV